jgi:hypothetical protein
MLMLDNEGFILLCFTAILTNSNHQHNGMEGSKKKEILKYSFRTAQ